MGPPIMAKRLSAALACASALLLALSAPATGLEVRVQLPDAGLPLPHSQALRVAAYDTGVDVGPATSGSPVPPGATPAPAPAPAAVPPGEAPSGGAPAAAGPASPTAGSTSPSAGEPTDTPAAVAGGTDSAPRRANRPPRRSVVERVTNRVPAALLAALLTALLAAVLLAAVLSLVWLRERRRVRAAQHEAHVDPLTGIGNRLAFEHQLAHEWRRARRYQRPLGVLMLDLDGLKRVNDSGGHEAGDRMIRTAAAYIESDTRQSDFVARLAGDEFVVLSPEAQVPGLQQLRSKLEQRLERGGIPTSIGWAELRDTDVRPEELLARADESMYRAKQSRRDARGAKAPADAAIAARPAPRAS